MPHKASFHPFLFALYPVLSFWVLNRSSVSIKDPWRTLFVSLIATGIIYLLTWQMARGKSALYSSLLIVAFFYFGHIYYSLGGKVPFLDQPVFFLIIWLVFFQLVFYLIFRFCREYTLRNQYWDSVSLILIVFPLGQLIWYSIQHPSVQYPISKPAASLNKNLNLTDNQPDVYYLIVDGYGRNDVLSEFFSFDNSDFLNTLKQRGFYVADQSSTNYTQTMLSFTSSMTGTYLDLARVDPKSEDRRVMQQYLDENSYVQRFNQLGYETLTMTNSSPIDFNFADRTLAAPMALNNFELGFQSLTIGRFWSPFAYEYAHWTTLRSELDILEQLPFNTKQPQFVFAHILAPHPPFVFDANGNFISTDSFLIGDGSHYQGTREEYARGYSQKVQYLNTRLIKIIDHLLSDPNRPVIIILQGDHGPGLYWDFESLDNSCLYERLSILNAYYLPYKNAREKLYPSISPVNSFRLIFDQILNQPTPLIDDRSYFSTWSHPYDFEDVSDEKETCNAFHP